MNLCGVARSLVDMCFDAVEAVAYAVFDFDEAADELWYRDDLVAKEAEEEVADPQCPCGIPWITGDPDRHSPFCKNFIAESSSSPLVSAGGGEPAASAHSPSASQAAGNQLTAEDLLDASFAAHAYAGRCTRDEVASKWSRLGNRLFDAAK